MLAAAKSACQKAYSVLPAPTAKSPVTGTTRRKIAKPNCGANN